MGKKKTETKSTNTYEYKAPPPTPEVEALKTMKATVDPSIPFNYAQQREDLDNSYNNPLGAYTTPAVRDAAARANNQRLSQTESQAVQASQFNADNSNFDRSATVAGYTKPQLVQTGGTGTQTQSGGFWGDLLNAGVGAAGQVGAAYV